MSLSGALSNALSGLNAASRSSQVTASNLSNATTPGYGRREVELGANGLGTHGGVSVLGTTRHMNPGLLSEVRLASAARAGSDETAKFHDRLETLIGLPSDPASLGATITRFESALVEAASRPDLTERLGAVLQSAEDLASGFKQVSDGIQSMRGEADRKIASDVDSLNTLLSQVRDINRQITVSTVNGRDSSALEDQRQVMIDSIAEIVPVKETKRELGAVALFTSGGAILLDGNAARVEFSATNMTAPHMTQAGGELSGLTINGRRVATDAEGGPMHGGRLGALFEFRDEIAPKIQTQVDATARDLVERFESAGLDATRTAGDPGLFTDGGAALAPGDETGLSGRLALNDAVVPENGGALWRLRDGLGAADPGPVGNGTLLRDMASALSEGRTPASGAFGPGKLSAAGLQSGLLDQISNDRNASELEQSFAAARFDSANSQLLAEGVDSDQEMQRLMQIEQAYAANARLLQTVGEMFDALIRI
ncbi:flagellar hook-associated protein FlgK [Aquicoccus sp.]|uniref:flagellar hook-associated protein FlgK n=1 Tax=Aquicoccus sp. TaxID=2055851 RepID=UPI003561D139